MKDRGFWAKVSDVTVLSGAGGDWRARSRSVQRHMDRLREEGADAGPDGPPQMASTARSRAAWRLGAHGGARGAVGMGSLLQQSRRRLLPTGP